MWGIPENGNEQNTYVYLAFIVFFFAHRFRVEFEFVLSKLT